MKINIITYEENWILRKLALQLKKRIPNVCLNRSNINDFDINYYINYSLYKNKSNNIDIAWFTHIEEKIPEMKEKFFWVATNVDHCVCHAKKYLDIIKTKSNKCVSQIVPGVDKLYVPKLIIGVIGRNYKYTDRKGEKILQKIRELDFIEIRYSNGNISENKMPDFYRELDYVLIPSNIEGGPMSLIEGLACGIPIIAPKDVGMVAEIKNWVYYYKNSDYKSLKKCLASLYRCKLNISKHVKDYTWERFADKHHKLFKKLYEARN